MKIKKEHLDKLDQQDRIEFFIRKSYILQESFFGMIILLVSGYALGIATMFTILIYRLSDYLSRGQVFSYCVFFITLMTICIILYLFYFVSLHIEDNKLEKEYFDVITKEKKS